MLLCLNLPFHISVLSYVSPSCYFYFVNYFPYLVSIWINSFCIRKGDHDPNHGPHELHWRQDRGDDKLRPEMENWKNNISDFKEDKFLCRVLISIFVFILSHEAGEQPTIHKVQDCSRTATVAGLFSAMWCKQWSS